MRNNAEASEPTAREAQSPMLINCVAYQDGSKLADLPVEQISDYISRPGCFVWVAMQDASTEELEEMRQEFGLHELAVEDAQHGHQRPKIEEYGNSMFAVLHLVESVGQDLNVGEVDVFVGPNYVLSVRNRSTQGFLGVRDRCEREPHLLKRGSGFVLYALMDAVVDRYFPHHRHARVRARDHRGADLRQGHGADQHRAALRPEAPRDGAQACGRAAAGGRQPSCTAAGCRRCAPARRSTSATWWTT